ncbi:MAG TPA: L,D-transpeptidase family protein [Solirubrobacteraceae bacterium]
MALAVLVPLIPIVIALTLGAGGAGPATTTVTATTAHFTPVPAAPKPQQANLLLPSGRGALVAAVNHDTVMRATPGGRAFAKLATKTTFGSPTTVWVARLSGRWLGVVTPQGGNNRLGWIPAADASLGRVQWELKVSLSARKLTVLHGSRVMERYTVAIGAPANPTPTGRFAVTDRLLTGDPAGPYGCCILALSALAPHAIQDWSGGNRIAIHSTPETSSIGQAVSHGCVRLTLPEGRWLIAHIPLGTPVYISG